MVDQRGPEQQRHGQPPEGGAPSSVPAWLLPVAALLAGLLIGGGAVALVSSDDDSDRARALPSPSPSDAASPEPAPAGADVLIRVPAPCVRVAGDAETAVQGLDELAVAVRDFDARELQEILDRLQKLRPQVEALADQCRNAAGRGLADGDLITPAPQPKQS